MITEQHLRFAEGVQLDYAKAYIELGSFRAVARKFNVNRSTVDKSIARLARRAAAADPSLHTYGAPEGYILRGVSTLTRTESGDPQWVKTQIDHDQRLTLLKDALEDIVNQHRGKLRPIAAPALCDDDLLAVYPLPDAHIGMHAWAIETGENFDLKTAEELYLNTYRALISTAPKAARALFINLGDYYHTDNSRNRTERAGNALDSDSRFGKIARVALRLKQQIIDMLLQRHNQLTVIVKAGNHDENSGVLLGAALDAIYDREPRVRVSDHTEARIEVEQFGLCLIAAAHGHTGKIDTIPGYVSARWPELWGATRHRVCYTGHVHHDSVIERPGMLVETLRTATPNDAYAAGAWYQAGRDLKCDVWHRERGRVTRVIQGLINP